MGVELSLPHLNIYAPGLEFILPYVAREIQDRQVASVDDPAMASVAVLSPGDEVPESLPVEVPVLFCPNIVGTGMKGLPMSFARMIARGTFYHLGGNDARLSTIHASDVARAINLVKETPGRFVVTDGEHPTYESFAEALAYRLGQKRILTLNSKWVRWIISPKLKAIITEDKVVDSSEFAARFNFKPTPVTQYLRTHVYDDESL